MTIEEVKILIVNSNIEEIRAYVSENRIRLKMLFNNATGTNKNISSSRQLTVFLHKLSKETKASDEIQFLFTIIAFYFKKFNNSAFVTTCINNLTSSILKYRLQAWHQYKYYTNQQSHITKFEAYLTKISKAISDEHEEYFEDILQDLYKYNIEYEHIPNFNQLFSEKVYRDKFPILEEYIARKSFLGYKIELHEDVDKIYIPSLFTEKLFKDRFIDYIRNHSETNWTQILLGYHKDVVRADIIKYGQANFDNSYKTLTSDEVVKLYCYFNMRQHFYSSLYLFERCSWIKELILEEGTTKFIDIGCGPATSGIALTDYLFSIDNSHKLFDYIGIDYYQAMLNAASDHMNNDVYTKKNKQQYLKTIKLMDPDVLEDANAILINFCYLFASPNLDVESLAVEINELLTANNDCPRFLLFQNVVDPTKSIKYAEFKKKLIAHNVLLSEKLKMQYNNQRNCYYPAVTISVFVEVLKF